MSELRVVASRYLTRLQSIPIFVLSFVLVPEPAAGTTLVFQGYTLHEYGGHYYSITKEKKIWSAAEEEATFLGGHLVAVNSQAEHEWLVQIFLPPADLVAPPVFWIGLTDDESFGGSESVGKPNPAVDGWIWTSGDPVTFTNWNDATATGGPLEPNNYLNEDFVAMNWHNVIDHPTDHVDIKGTWNDFVPAGADGLAVGPYHGIIELSFNPVPEPATAILAIMGLAGLFRRAR